MSVNIADGGVARPLHIALCSAALLPPLILPGLGAMVSLALVLVVLWVISDSRKPVLDWRFGSVAVSVFTGLVAAAAISLLMYLADPLIQGIFGAVDLENFSSVRGDASKYLMLLAIGIGFGGFAEELIFRGYVIGWGTRLLGERAGYPLAFLSAGAFGFTHLYQGWGGVVQTGAIGLALGILYVACDRKLLPAVIAHMAINAWGITQIYLGNA